MPHPESVDAQSFKVINALLSQGGRYLLVRVASTRYNELRLLDLENEDALIWSFDLETISEYLLNDQSLILFSFTVCRDGSLIVAVAMRPKYDPLSYANDGRYGKKDGDSYHRQGIN